MFDEIARGGCGTGERRRGGECESSDSTHSVHDRRALRQFTRGFTVSSDANLSRSFFFPFSPLPFIRPPSSIPLPPPSSFTPLYIQRCFNADRFSRDLFFSLFLFLFFFPFPFYLLELHSRENGVGLLEKLSREIRTVSKIILKNFRRKIEEGSLSVSLWSGYVREELFSRRDETFRAHDAAASLRALASPVHFSDNDEQTPIPGVSLELALMTIQRNSHQGNVAES